jgi:hypothetical protein
MRLKIITLPILPALVAFVLQGIMGTELDRYSIQRTLNQFPTIPTLGLLDILVPYFSEALLIYTRTKSALYRSTFFSFPQFIIERIPVIVDKLF